MKPSVPSRIEWPTAAVLIAAVLTIGAAYLFAEDGRTELIAGIGTVSTAVLALMERMVREKKSGSRDTEADGADRARDDWDDDE